MDGARSAGIAGFAIGCRRFGDGSGRILLHFFAAGDFGNNVLEESHEELTHPMKSVCENDYTVSGISEMRSGAKTQRPRPRF